MKISAINQSRCNHQRNIYVRNGLNLVPFNQLIMQAMGVFVLDFLKKVFMKFKFFYIIKKVKNRFIWDSNYF